MKFHRNIAIVEGDTHLSKWVVEHDTLQVQRDYWLLFKKYIPVGGFAIDVGACLGDSTATFGDLVGPQGKVWAFEPNPPALECLRHNMHGRGNTVCFGTALGEFKGNAYVLAGDNLGASQLRSGGNIKVTTLDYLVLDLLLYGAGAPSRIDFIKIDAEGWEGRILRGAMATLAKHRPVMVIEINRPVLAEQGLDDKDILIPLADLGYTVTSSEPHIPWDSSMLDVLCLP